MWIIFCIFAYNVNFHIKLKILIKISVFTRDLPLNLTDLSMENFEIPPKISIIIQSFLFIVIQVNRKYEKERIARNIFLTDRVTKKENKAINQLLSILVPEAVKDCLIDGTHILSEDQGNVTILFCDICNFDEIIKNENIAIINLLDELYRKFDTFCLESHVQKIEVRINFIKINLIKKLKIKDCWKNIYVLCWIEAKSL